MAIMIAKPSPHLRRFGGTHWKSRNLHNRVVEIQGQRIAGLGGVFRGQIWMPPNKPMYLTPSTIANIARKKKFGVAVYHCVIARLFPF